MIKLQSTLNVMENGYEIDKYWDEKVFLKTTAERRKQLIEYIENEHKGLFDRIDDLRDYNYSQVDMKHAMSEMRDLYEHEKQMLMESYMTILDETAENIEYIDDKFICSKKPLEISKKFAINFKCEEEKNNHNYSEQIDPTGIISSRKAKYFN